MPVCFSNFSSEHSATLAVGFGTILLILWVARIFPRARPWTTGLLAFLNVGSYPLTQAAWLAYGQQMGMENILPFHLCDVASLAAGFALLTRSPLLGSLTYFWGLAATVQALATPALSVEFPNPPYIMFFTQHFAIVAVALYLPLVEGWRPKSPWWRSPLEVYGWSVGYLLAALTLNFFLKTNFGFASHPPDNPSLIDYLGKWPIYLWWMSLIALALYLLLALPFCRKRRVASPGK